jgi:uncharacterized protein YxjI
MKPTVPRWMWYSLKHNVIITQGKDCTLNAAFRNNHFILRRQIFALTGKFRIYEPNGTLAFFSQQKMFKLKEDIRVYSDESMTVELLYIKARSIIDFSAAYDVIDSVSSQKVGVWRRKGFRSILRDEWEMLDPSDNPCGILTEDNITQALLRRFLLGHWLPQNYDILINNRRMADIKQRFNLFRYELEIDLLADASGGLDPRMGLAAAILLATIEGRQE